MILRHTKIISFFIFFLLTSCSFISKKKETEKYVKDEYDIVQFYLNKYGEESASEYLMDLDYVINKMEIKGIISAQADSVFVMPVISASDKGDSYYFCNQAIPRLQTDSYCCHPENLNTIEDIDEDGINEVVIFYSSCSSRYKSLRVYSLKDTNWVEIGASDFDILTKDPEEVTLSTLVRKTKKDEFEICNFYDGETYWTKINLNNEPNHDKIIDYSRH